MTRRAAIALNLVAFDVCWAATMLGTGGAWWWAGPALVALSFAGQLGLSPAPPREAALILGGAAVGVALDGLGVALGFLRYANGNTAEFLLVFAALWVNFGTTLRPAFRWLWNRPALGAALGAVGGPLAYYGGARLGAIAFTDPLWAGLAWVAIQYGIAVPVWMAIARRVLSELAGTGRRPNGLGQRR